MVFCRSLKMLYLKELRYDVNNNVDMKIDD